MDNVVWFACVLELARVFATHRFPGTIVFVDRGRRGAGVVRLLLHGPADGLCWQRCPGRVQVGGENDGVSRQLRRFVKSVAPVQLTGTNIRLIWRRDRYLRGSDHLSFQGNGYPAARFTEPRENFNHAHQNTQVVDGVQLGDLIDFVDFDYVARVTGVNAAALWGLAASPSTPKNAKIHTAPPGTFSGTNLTTMDWTANPEINLTGYEVVMRETTESDWIQAMPVGNVASVALDISKDNVQFGIRAVDDHGNRSPVAFPPSSYLAKSRAIARGLLAGRAPPAGVASASADDCRGLLGV